jgi:isoaspartyl peptidase/L-asparaginase-like protein (Ntn-hydrolase superfamily)
MSLLLAGSINAHVGFHRGMSILRPGGAAIDAVVGTIRQVEANPNDHSVGFGGLPNLEGEVELDASIMDGRALATVPWRRCGVSGCRCDCSGGHERATARPGS